MLVWWPFAVALQGEAANHREVRRSRAGVLSVAGKGAPLSASGVDHEGERERTTDDVSKSYGWHQNRGCLVVPGGAWRVPADWPGGVRHKGGASVVWALVRNSGTCRPDRAVG